MNRINLEINLVRRCQLSCTNCNRLVGLFRDDAAEEDMSVRQILRFINQLDNSPVKVKRVKLLGGEPLLHPHFAEVYRLLTDAIDEGLIQKVKIESNGIIARPDLPPHENIQWAGKPVHRKRHLPVLWSPRDLGHETTGPCSMPRICGPSLDAYGYSLCSVAVMMYRVFRREDLYQDEFPGSWQEDFRVAIDEMCPECLWSMPEEWKEAHVYPLDQTPEKATVATPTWAHYLRTFDGKPKKARW